jgi:hypothetical protein
MKYPFATALTAGLVAVALGACGSSRTTESKTHLAPVTFGAALETASAGAAPAYRPAATQPLYGGGITLTSVKVVLAGINLAGMGERMADDATGPGMQKSRKRDGMGSDDGGMMNGRSGDDHVRTVDQVDFAGPFVWDLTSRTVTPALEPVSIPTGTYHRLDLIFDPLTAAAAQGMGLDASDPVVGHSYVIEGYLNHVTYGTVTDGTVKLRIFGDQARTFHVPLHQGIAVTPGGVNDVLLTFGADGWFPSSLVGQLRAGLATGDVTVDTAGAAPVVVLDASRNMAIAAQFHKLFHGSMRVAKDTDGDAKIEGDEPADDVPAE